MLKRFVKEEFGASLVEYAVALIVVTIVGGGGVIAVGTNAGVLASASNQSVANSVAALP